MKSVCLCGTRNIYHDMIPCIKSVLKNTDVDKIYLLIEDDEFTEWLPNKCKCINVSGQELFDPEGPNYKSHWTYMAMMMCGLTKYIPDEKVLYLDYDVLVLEDISELWDMDMTDYYFAAGIEPQRSRKNYTYCNTGVVMFNLDKLREDGKDDEAIHALNTKVYRFPDQDVMNDVCQGHIRILDPMYSHTLVGCTQKSKHPKIKHYAGMLNWQTSPRILMYRNMKWKDILPVVLFTSNRLLGRAENITAVWNMYTGDKIFSLIGKDRTSKEIKEGDYSLIVTDEPVARAKAPEIMIYHGAALGKTYLLQRQGNRHDKNVLDACSHIKYAVTSSDTSAAMTMTAFQCGLKPDQVLPLGMPRMDELLIQDSRKQNPMFSNYRRVYLYAPTYRKLCMSELPDINLDKIDELLTDDEVFLVKPHMVMANLWDGAYKHIMSVSADEPSNKYLLIADVLVTDYSSIMMDAHVAGVPVVLFEKDYDTYKEEIGMCMAYPDSYASRHTQDEEELVELMRDAAEHGQGKEDITCRDIAANKCDGHATDRVVMLIEQLIEEIEDDRA